jgi:predicted phage tail protein
MKPAWDALMDEYAGNPSILVADVDCTAAGESLCQKVGVQGYPTIKHGDPNDLQDYQGGRSEEDLKSFAQTLGPSCGPKSLDLCDEAKKASIETYLAMDYEQLQKMVEEKEAIITTAEKDFNDAVSDLQSRYEDMKKAKDATIKEVKDSGLGMMKAVQTAAKASKAEL